MTEPKFVYIGFNGTQPQLVISDRELQPAGKRLEKGTAFPQAVTDFYLQPFTEKTAREGAGGLQNYLQGIETGSSEINFGDELPKVRRVKK